MWYCIGKKEVGGISRYQLTPVDQMNDTAIALDGFHDAFNTYIGNLDETKRINCIVENKFYHNEFDGASSESIGDYLKKCKYLACVDGDFVGLYKDNGDNW